MDRAHADLAIATNRSASRNGGYVLVFVAAFLFALFGIAALCIETGYVVLAQQKMEQGAEAPALEGLRYRYDA